MKSPSKCTLSRREAIATLGALAATCQTVVASAATPKKEGKKAMKGMALQLYTMREPAKQDLAGTLKKVREMGWEYVQWSGMPDLPAEKIREALDTAGLKCIACHTGVEPFEKDFDTNVKFWKTVGTTYVGPGGMMGDCKDTLKAWQEGAKRLDTLGAKLRGAGLHLTYHNHAGEFEKFADDPRSKLDILYESTKPENLCAELDLAWVHVGGADPAAYIRKCKGRCPTIHAKDYSGKAEKKVNFTPLGKGILNWPEIFAAGKEAGIEWYIYEQDSCEGSPFDCAQVSFEFLAKNLK